jgi:hypothetical protein
MQCSYACSIFTLLTPASLIGVPFVEPLIHHYGFHGGLQAINLLGLAYTIVKIATRSLNLQIFGFILFSLYRCFLFSITFSYIPTFIRFDVVGQATGLAFFCTAVLSIINIPLAQLAVEKLQSFWWPNAVWATLNLPCVLAAWQLGRFIKLEDRQKIEDNKASPKR